MKLTPEKCQWLGYKYTRRTWVAPKDTIKVGDQEIRAMDLKDGLKYLGAIIGTTRSPKKQYVRTKLQKLSNEMDAIWNSPLRFNQKLHATKTFALSQIVFLLQNGVLPEKYADSIDQHLRVIINKNLQITGTPISLFYSHWKDGGLGLATVRERTALLQSSLFLHLTNDADEDLVRFFTQSQKDEIKFRRITESGPFFGLPAGTRDQRQQVDRGTNNLFIRAAKALEHLQIGIENDQLTDRKGIEEPTLLDNKTFLKTTGKWLRRRYQRELHDLKTHGHGFLHITDSTASTYFIGNEKARLADHIQRFAIGARVNQLPTKYNVNVGNEALQLCNVCGTNETLMHVLNGCMQYGTKYTERHNAVAAIIAEELRKKRFIVNENSTIQFRGARRLPPETREQKPDLWWIDHKDPKTLHLLEISVPYNQMTEEADKTPIWSLEKVRKEKAGKYQDLCRDVTRIFNLPTKTHVLIVSSLGVIPKMAVKVLKLLFGESRAKGIAKEIANAVLHKSAQIFYGYPNPQQQQQPQRRRRHRNQQQQQQQARNNENNPPEPDTIPDAEEEQEPEAEEEEEEADSIEEEVPEQELPVGEILFHARPGTA